MPLMLLIFNNEAFDEKLSNQKHAKRHQLTLQDWIGFT